MEIGEVEETIIVEPITDPIPREAPAPAEAPIEVETPERELVPA